MTEDPLHFKGKDAARHVAEAQAEGVIGSSEIHGTEVPGHLSAGADAARETAFLVLIFSLFPLSLQSQALILVGWLIWKVGRSAWLGWGRLERLHRILAQEKWEIEHNRDQERAELKELYRAKGFEGDLLEDVMNVLMADGDRLLKIMVEEELGLSLQHIEHPLKQAFGALIGVILGALTMFWAPYLPVIAIAAAGGLTAYYAQNKVSSAVIWNAGIALAGFGTVYFLKEFLQ